MDYSIFQGIQSPSFAMPEHILDDSETSVSEAQPEANRTELDCHTWNWTEAATEVNTNESTLRKVWWEKKLEPVFIHCPQPLRVTTRTTGSGRQIAEFTAFGIEVLKAYKTALEIGDRAAEVFLAKARDKYRAPRTPSSEPVESALPATIEVDTGSTIVITAPELPQTYSLANFQTIESLEFDDPLGLANQIVQAVDQVQNAMQLDIERKVKKLNDTRRAKEIVTAKVQELKLDQRFYQEKNSQLSTAQTQDTQTLQELATLLQGLGKSPAAPSSPPG